MVYLTNRYATILLDSQMYHITLLTSDVWHLDQGLCKLFGKSGYTEYHNTAENLLQSQDKPNQGLMKTLEDFASRRQTYANYCLAELPGNLGRQYDFSA